MAANVGGGTLVVNPRTALLPYSAVSDLPYTSYSRWLAQSFGRRVYRVAVDGGFSCPNRGERSGAGCTFCAEDGSRAPYLGEAATVRAQVGRAVGFLTARYKAQAFILYFQAFSATNAPPAALRRIYDEGLSAAPFVGLTVSTRPDCVDGEKAALLASYRDRGLEVWVELGLESANDQTLERIGRGHDLECFRKAYRTLKAAGLKVAVHLILGLPGETREDMERTAETAATLLPDGVKIHNLHIPAGTVMAAEMSKGEITAPGPWSHLQYTISVLERLPPSTVVMRVTTDTPASRLLSPRTFPDKQAFLTLLAEEMKRRGTFQGARFTPPGAP